MAIELHKSEELMKMISVITSEEEDKYSDIPGWTDLIETWTSVAVLLAFEGRRPSRHNWYPISQLRRTEDGLSLYASRWLLDKKGL